VDDAIDRIVASIQSRAQVTGQGQV
jgi:hypothetical protein